MDAVMSYIESHNDDPSPFHWSKTAEAPSSSSMTRSPSSPLKSSFSRAGHPILSKRPKLEKVTETGAAAVHGSLGQSSIQTPVVATSSQLARPARLRANSTDRRAS